MPIKLPEFKVKWYVSVFVIFIGLLILLISLANASWASLNADNNLDKFRINPIEFQITNEAGEKENVKYFLPQVNQISGNNFYWMKKIRDQIWLNLSSNKGKKNKSDMYLLLADKRIAEVLILSQTEGSKKLMYEFSLEAVNYINKATDLTDKMENPIESNKIGYKIDNAKFFYGEIFDQIGKIDNQVDIYKQLSDQLRVGKK